MSPDGGAEGNRLPREIPGYLSGHVGDLVALQARVGHARWLASTGQSDDDLILPEGDHAWLSSGELIARALACGDLRYAGELVLWYFRVSLAEPTARLRRLQRTITVDVDGRAFTHSELVALSRTATTVSQRAQAESALASANARLRDARRHWLEDHAAARARLGFATHGALVRALHPEVDRFTEHARAWLDDTRAEFLEQWRHWRDRDGLSTPALGDARLIAARAAVPENAVGSLASVRSTVRAWGLGAHLDHILVDDAARPGKVGFAFCSPVAPPTDVRVSTTGGTTLGHYVTLLHEFGHALHFTAGARHPADLWHVPTALSEAFGFTLEGVVRRPEWQRRHLGVTVDPESVERVRFAREHVRRVVATSLQFEMAVHDGHPDPPGEYVRRYESEFDVAVDGQAAWDRLQMYLEGHPCYPLVYHQAFSIRERLWDHLVARKGDRWYLEPDVAPALRSLFELFGTTQLEDWFSPFPGDGVQRGELQGKG